MPARRVKPVRALDQAKIPVVTDDETSRALDVVGDALQSLQSRPDYAIVEGVDLAVGRNVVPHQLGRTPKIVLVTPTVADATFAYAVDKNNAHAERQVFITVVGVAQPAVNLFLM